MQKVTFVRDWRFQKTPETHVRYIGGREYSVADEVAKAALKDGAIEKEKADAEPDQGSAAGDSAAAEE